MRSLLQLHAPLVCTSCVHGGQRRAGAAEAPPGHRRAPASAQRPLRSSDASQLRSCDARFVCRADAEGGQPIDAGRDAPPAVKVYQVQDGAATLVPADPTAARVQRRSPLALLREAAALAAALAATLRRFLADAMQVLPAFTLPSAGDVWRTTLLVLVAVAVLLVLVSGIDAASVWLVAGVFKK